MGIRDYWPWWRIRYRAWEACRWLSGHLGFFNPGTEWCAACERYDRHHLRFLARAVVNLSRILAATSAALTAAASAAAEFAEAHDEMVRLTDDSDGSLRRRIREAEEKREQAFNIHLKVYCQGVVNALLLTLGEEARYGEPGTPKEDG